MITVDSRNAKLAEVTTPAVLAAQRAQLSAPEYAALSKLKTHAESQQPMPIGFSRERESLRLAVGQL